MTPNFLAIELIRASLSRSADYQAFKEARSMQNSFSHFVFSNYLRRVEGPVW